MEQYKSKYETGKLRKRNPAYAKLIYKRRVTEDPIKKMELTKIIRNTPSVVSMDRNFKRLMYIRYADDFVIFISGSKNEATYIKNNVKDILKHKCGAELNDEKTVISNTKRKFDFLGATIQKPTSRNFLIKRRDKKVKAQTRMLMLAPLNKLLEKLVSTGFAYRNKKGETIPQAYNALVNLDHYSIIAFFNSKLNGILNYYSFATNRNRLRYVL